MGTSIVRPCAAWPKEIPRPPSTYTALSTRPADGNDLMKTLEDHSALPSEAMPFRPGTGHPCTIGGEHVGALLDAGVGSKGLGRITGLEGQPAVAEGSHVQGRALCCDVPAPYPRPRPPTQAVASPGRPIPPSHWVRGGREQRGERRS